MSDVGMLTDRLITDRLITDRLITDRLITDLDLARARQDPIFRRQLAADHLELLLSGLNKLRGSAPDPARAQQIREGVDLAVRLAALLQKITAAGPAGAA